MSAVAATGPGCAATNAAGCGGRTDSAALFEGGIGGVKVSWSGGGCIGGSSAAGEGSRGLIRVERRLARSSDAFETSKTRDTICSLSVEGASVGGIGGERRSLGGMVREMTAMTIFDGDGR